MMHENLCHKFATQRQHKFQGTHDILYNYILSVEPPIFVLTFFLKIRWAKFGHQIFGLESHFTICIFCIRIQIPPPKNLAFLSLYTVIHSTASVPCWPLGYTVINLLSVKVWKICFCFLTSRFCWVPVLIQPAPKGQWLWISGAVVQQYPGGSTVFLPSLILGAMMNELSSFRCLCLKNSLGFKFPLFVKVMWKFEKNWQP